MVRPLLLPFFGACLTVMLFTSMASAQSITSGDITGTIIDPSGAAAPNATVTITNVGTNTSQSALTSQQGTYRFAFLAPGTYTLNVKATGFQTQQRTGIVVRSGQPTVEDMTLQVAAASQTVEVSASGDVVQTGNGDVSTTYNTQMIENLPNPGNDLTYYAQTTAGVTMNTQAGYSNFVVEGMPGEATLFNVNGVNYNDSFRGSITAARPTCCWASTI